uniref:PrdX deacylase domain-containing protein 1 n=1 Tax=Oncorhynchus kisutch TaxID=8019 RepID=A0A8C7DFA2_ONCKI
MYFSPLGEQQFTLKEMMPGLPSGAASVPHDRLVNLNSLAKNLGLGSGNLCCATALELFCDKDQSVKFVHVHPITNASIMGLKLEDLTFLKDTGHEPVLQSFN